MKSFFALVTPFDPSLKPDHTLPGPQPKPPTGGQPPRPDHTLPGDLPRPTHPIYLPVPPGAPIDPGWVGGVAPPGQEGGAPRPDQGLPGPQPHPEHPIVLPPDDGSWKPIYIWGPTDPRPTPPIVIPPNQPAPPESGTGAEIKFKAIWTPENGWQTIGIVVPGEGGKPVPTPSRK